MFVFKRNQVVIVSLVLLIIVAGVLNYSYNKSSDSGIGSEAFSGNEIAKDNDRIGEPAYVFEEDHNANVASADKQAVSEKNSIVVSDKENIVINNVEEDAYFASARYDKDSLRDKNVEKLDNIAKNPAASKEDKSKAYEHMMTIIKNSEAEMQIEKTLKAKGFSDVFAMVEEGNVEIVVKSEARLTEQKAALILDVVKRHTKAKAEEIHIIPRVSS